MKKKYSYLKSIRFNLEEEKGKLQIPEKKEIEKIQLLQDTKDFIVEIKEFLYKKDKEKILIKKIDNLFVIKNNFLKQYFKNEFFSRPKSKDCSVAKVNYLHEKLDTLVFEKENKESLLYSLEGLEKLVDTKEHAQQRKTEIAALVLKICSKNYFFLLRDFLEPDHLNHKDNSKEIKKFSKKFNSLLEKWLIW